MTSTCSAAFHRYNSAGGWNIYSINICFNLDNLNAFLLQAIIAIITVLIYIVDPSFACPLSDIMKAMFDFNKILIYLCHFVCRSYHLPQTDRYLALI